LKTLVALLPKFLCQFICWVLKPEPPAYNPTYWNDCSGPEPCAPWGTCTAVIQCNNNCYNYANNKRTDTFAQPGLAGAGHEFSADCAGITAGALADALVEATGACSGCCHRVALVIWPGTDYHWYRLDKNGRWSHKPGHTPVRDVDESNQPITNPETADRGGYTVFCGYFCSCRCNVKIN